MLLLYGTVSPNSSRLNGSMFAFRRTISLLRPFSGASRASAASSSALCCPRLRQPLPAQGTHLWTQSQMEEFEKGTPQGVAITSDGHLRQGPGLTELLTTPSTFVWSVAVDKNGAAYVGTGSPATVLRVGTTEQALHALRDQRPQRAGGPSWPRWLALRGHAAQRQGLQAQSRRHDQAGRAAPRWSSTPPSLSARPQTTQAGCRQSQSKPHYIWDLTFDTAGRLYIATGDPGAVYRVDPSKPAAKPELFFKSDEAHIRALAWDAKGNLIAGSDGSGLVYRIDPQGKGYVLFDAPRREITSIAVAANGTIYAACVGDKSHNPLPPLPVQGGAHNHHHRRAARFAAGSQHQHLRS